MVAFLVGVLDLAGRGLWTFINFINLIIEARYGYDQMQGGSKSISGSRTRSQTAATVTARRQRSVTSPRSKASSHFRHHWIYPLLAIFFNQMYIIGISILEGMIFFEYMSPLRCEVMRKYVAGIVSFAKLFMYLTFLTRCDHVYRDTVYQYRKRTIRVWYGIIYFETLTFAIFVALYAKIDTKKGTGECIATYPWTIIIWMTQDLVTQFSMLFLFVRVECVCCVSLFLSLCLSVSHCLHVCVCVCVCVLFGYVYVYGVKAHFLKKRGNVSTCA